MGDRDVVALEVVVGDDLPVGRLASRPYGGAARGARCRRARGAPAGRRPARRAASRGCRGSRTRARAASRTRAGNSPSADLSSSGDRARLGHADQLAVEAIGPAVVAAADRLAALAAPGQQARAAVAADVAEGAQVAVVVAQHEHRLVAGRGGQVAAGLRQLRDVRRELPGALEDAVAARARRPRGRGRSAPRERAAGRLLRGRLRSGPMRGPDFVISRMIPWPRGSVPRPPRMAFHHSRTRARAAGGDRHAARGRAPPATPPSRGARAGGAARHARQPARVAGLHRGGGRARATPRTPRSERRRGPRARARRRRQPRQPALGLRAAQEDRGSDDRAPDRTPAEPTAADFTPSSSSCASARGASSTRC